MSSKEQSLIVGLLGLAGLTLVLFADFVGAGLGAYADQRFALGIAMGGLCVFAVISCARQAFVKISFTLKLLLPTLILCCAFLLLSLPYRDNEYVWVEPGMYSLFFLSTCLVGVSLRWADPDLTYSMFLPVGFTAICSMYGFSCITVYLFAVLDRDVNFLAHIPYGFENFRYWSHISSWCLPLMPLALLTGPFKNNRLWAVFIYAGMGLWWWLLFLTTARGSFLGIMVGGIVVVLFLGRLSFPWIKVVFKSLLLGVVIWAFLSVLIPLLVGGEIQLRPIKSHGSGRELLFSEAWVMSLENFPFGMGPQSWLTHSPLTDGYSVGKKIGHPHNMYLLWAAEYGWLLVLAVGFLVMQVVRCFLLQRQRALLDWSQEKVILLVGFTASVVAALFHAGVSAVFMAPGSMLVGLFVLIAFWSLVAPSPRVPLRATAGDSSISKHRTATAILISVVLIVVWLHWLGCVSSYYHDMRLDLEPYYERGGETLPRFWLHGNFPRLEG